MPHTSDGRFQKCGEKPRSADQTPVLGFRDVRFCCRKSVCARRFPVFPSLPKIAIKKPTVPKRKRDKCPSENSPLNAKTAFRRFPRTKPDVPSQGLITVGTLRKNPISVNPLPASRSELRLSSNASVKLHVSRKTPATTSFPNRDVSFDRPNLTSEQKEGRRINPLQVSPEGLHRAIAYILVDSLCLSMGPTAIRTSLTFLRPPASAQYSFSS